MFSSFMQTLDRKIYQLNNNASVLQDKLQISQRSFNLASKKCKYATSELMNVAEGLLVLESELKFISMKASEETAKKEAFQKSLLEAQGEVRELRRNLDRRVEAEKQFNLKMKEQSQENKEKMSRSRIR